MTEPADQPTETSTPTGTVTTVLDELREHYRAALERHAKGEAVRFELSMFPLPTEQPGEFNTVLSLYFEIKGAILGTVISATRLMQPMGHDEITIDFHAREMMESIVEARSKQLDQQRIDAEEATRRGTAIPVAGAILLDAERPNTTFDEQDHAMNGFVHGE